MNSNDPQVNTAFLEQKYFIIAPMGGFGNHVRWLALLDPKFSISLAASKGRYEKLSGLDWPDYDDYCRGRISGVRDDVREEMHKMGFLPGIIFDDDIDKVSYLLNTVYDRGRNWHNWLQREFWWRGTLDRLIGFQHRFPKNLGKSCACLALTVEPRFSLWTYFKFNGGLNNLTVPGYLKMIESCNQSILQKNGKSNVEIINAEDLYAPVLDLKIYQKMVDLFDLDDRYDQAQILHARWYELHEKSRAEFAQYVKNLYPTNVVNDQSGWCVK